MKNTNKQKIIEIFILISLFNSISFFIRGGLSIYNISSYFLPRNPTYIIFSLIIPIILWVLSTAHEYYNYWNRKIGFVYYIAANILVVFSGQLLRLIIPLILPMTLRIPISSEVTPGMVVNLSRGIILLISAAPVIGLGVLMANIINDENNQETIVHFKLLKHIDTRKNKKFAYDLKIVSNLKTGKPYIIKEQDRTLHALADGTTGTGKTSSITSMAICGDLEQRVYNENYQKKRCMELLKNGEIEIDRYFKDEDFSIDYFSVNEDRRADTQKTKTELNYLKYTCKTIGITCLAPNEDFSDQVYQMAVSRNIKVNRIDPILTPKNEFKKDFIGFNPYYISPKITGISRDVDITNKAIIFSDVLQSLYVASGAGDPYFISLNQSVTINISKLLLLTFDLVEHRPPHPGDFQNCINDFSRCDPYLKKLVELYGNNGIPINSVQTDMIEDRVRYVVDSRQKNIDCGQWQDVYALIQFDLLGPNRDNMYDRCNGLRIQVNNFLNHPLIRRVLCATHTIDLDAALESGEITIVNYALELGKSVSSAFGLFFILSYAKAVLRRPGSENTRKLHQAYIEEFTFLMHPAFEEFFTMHRQYKAANFVFFQTLDQMEKNENTKYLKGILLGNCAHQFVFGRVSPTEMKTYETMAGKVMKPMEQKTVSETSLSSESPSYSYSSRTTAQLGNLLEGHSIRNRDFQEVTVFTVDRGNYVSPFAGKVHFLSPKMRKGHKLKEYNWEPYMPQKEAAEIKETTHDIKFHPGIYVKHELVSSSTRFTANGIEINKPCAVDAVALTYEENCKDRSEKKITAAEAEMIIPIITEATHTGADDNLLEMIREERA